MHGSSYVCVCVCIYNVDWILPWVCVGSPTRRRNCHCDRKKRLSSTAPAGTWVCSSDQARRKTKRQAHTLFTRAERQARNQNPHKEDCRADREHICPLLSCSFSSWLFVVFCLLSVVLGGWLAGGGGVFLLFLGGNASLLSTFTTSYLCLWLLWLVFLHSSLYINVLYVHLSLLFLLSPCFFVAAL